MDNIIDGNKVSEAIHETEARKNRPGIYRMIFCINRLITQAVDAKDIDRNVVSSLRFAIFLLQKCKYPDKIPSFIILPRILA